MRSLRDRLRAARDARELRRHRAAIAAAHALLDPETTVAVTTSTLSRAINTRLTEDDMRRLRAYADREGISTCEALRQHIRTLPPPASDTPSRRRETRNSTAFR